MISQLLIYSRTLSFGSATVSSPLPPGHVYTITDGSRESQALINRNRLDRKNKSFISIFVIFLAATVVC